MLKAIATTTINPPTEALRKYAEIAKRNDWHIFIAGDLKTPHSLYEDFAAEFPGVITYLYPKEQTSMHAELSNLIGWNCIQRRNFALLAAWEWGAEVIATIDDDNIPYDNWGRDLYVGYPITLDQYDTPGPVFNPLARHDFGYQGVNICKDPETAYTESLWHRGVPIQQLDGRDLMKDVHEPIGRTTRKVLVQADMWDGDPDIDAVTRIVLHPEVKFTHKRPYAGTKIGPFNSQNTFISAAALPWYFLFPHIGRMDDIWASYVLQTKFPDSVIYGPATVYQERNPHDLSKDLAAEQLGYSHSNDFVEYLQDPDHKLGVNWPAYMPDEAIRAFEIWQNLVTDAR